MAQEVEVLDFRVHLSQLMPHEIAELGTQLHRFIAQCPRLIQRRVDRQIGWLRIGAGRDRSSHGHLSGSGWP